MPIPEDIRIQLYKSLSAFRGEDSHFTGPRWTDSEVNAATKTLAALPDPVPALLIRAWHHAGKASNNRAATITHPVEVEAVIRQLPARLEQNEPCPKHESPVRNDEGRLVCCEQERVPDVAAPFVRRPVADYSDEAKSARRQSVVDAMEVGKS